MIIHDLKIDLYSGQLTLLLDHIENNLFSKFKKVTFLVIF